MDISLEKMEKKEQEAMRETESTGWTFSQIPIWALCDDRISNGAKVLFGYLRWRQGKNACSWPSRGKMAEDLFVSKKTISRWLQELKDVGYVGVQYREGRSSLYVTHANPNNSERKYTPKDNRTSPEKQLTI